MTPTTFAPTPVVNQAPPVLSLETATPVASAVQEHNAYPASLSGSVVFNHLQASSARVAQLMARVDNVDFSRLKSSDLVIVSPAEVGLNKVLEQYMARIDKVSYPALFKLVDALSQEVDKQNLPQVANAILNAKPTPMQKLVGLLSKKKMREALDKAYGDACRVLSGRSQTLADYISQMEKTLAGEMSKLSIELKQLEELKEDYQKCFDSFVDETFMAYALADRAKAYAESLKGRTELTHQYEDALAMAQALESRALALEGTMTRLPADQLVIRQIQNAGVSTLIELGTTMAGRFASIRATLITLNSTRMVQDVQRLGERGANLDSNLIDIRNQLTRDVVTTASTAPGKNRVAQVNQVEAIVKNTAELHTLVAEAREQNAIQFSQARNQLRQVQQELLQLGNKIHPNKEIHIP